MAAAWSGNLASSMSLALYSMLLILGSMAATCPTDGQSPDGSKMCGSGVTEEMALLQKEMTMGLKTLLLKASDASVLNSVAEEHARTPLQQVLWKAQVQGPDAKLSFNGTSHLHPANHTTLHQTVSTEMSSTNGTLRLNENVSAEDMHLHAQNLSLKGTVNSGHSNKANSSAGPGDAQVAVEQRVAEHEHEEADEAQQPKDAWEALSLVHNRFPEESRNASVALFLVFKEEMLDDANPTMNTFETQKRDAELLVATAEEQIKNETAKNSTSKNETFYDAVRTQAQQEAKLEFLAVSKADWSTHMRRVRESSMMLWRDTKSISELTGSMGQKEVKRFFDNATAEIHQRVQSLEKSNQEASDLREKAIDLKGKEGVEEAYATTLGKAAGVKEMSITFMKLLDALKERIANASMLIPHSENKTAVENKTLVENTTTADTDSSTEGSKRKPHPIVLVKEKSHEYMAKEDAKDAVKTKSKEKVAKNKDKAHVKESNDTATAEHSKYNQLTKEEIQELKEREELKVCASPWLVLNPLSCAVTGVRMINKLTMPSTIVHKYREYVGTEESPRVKTISLNLMAVAEATTTTTTTTRKSAAAHIAPHLAGLAALVLAIHWV
eukprot:gnl/TRDRNA2_/TRDRNA2_175488_c14_seq4.p1 gnl/TRDRNA2_/TRDRNA2_175488_c14~~gnl/TRDRNA2_/TRDRNA2_175488_c14_seq4.p1  ORF type:complete len:612 (-),score=159.14 gnl/TRDRNA2_/TRDRNA2_175488_c14_seq4:189-2024(-)